MAIPDNLRKVLVEKMTDEFGDEAKVVEALTSGEKPIVHRRVIEGIFHPDRYGARPAPDYQEDGDNATMTLCDRYKSRLDDTGKVVPRK